jgi:hypothetical protein
MLTYQNTPQQIPRPLNIHSLKPQLLLHTLSQTHFHPNLPIKPTPFASFQKPRKKPNLNVQSDNLLNKPQNKPTIYAQLLKGITAVKRPIATKAG